MKLKNKLAFITGGGRGIGREIARVFAHEGANVIVAARSREQVEQVAEEIRNEFGVDAFSVVCDVANVESVKNAFATAREHFKAMPDILVNNAGIAESAPFHKTSDELWHRIIEINLSGTFFCMREALPAMLEKGWGRVINIASIAGKAGAAYIAAYVASKHGVVGLTRSLAVEVATKGITVNAICPGYVETDMAQYAIDSITTKTKMSAEDAKKYLENQSPQARMVTVEEVAALALLLASEEGRGINAQAINIDGGGVQH